MLSPHGTYHKCSRQLVLGETQSGHQVPEGREEVKPSLTSPLFLLGSLSSLKCLQRDSFKPLQPVELKLLSLKTVLLTVLTVVANKNVRSEEKDYVLHVGPQGML